MEAQKSLCNSDSYWIHGSTDMTVGRTIAFSGYNFLNSGKLHRLRLIYFTNVISSNEKVLAPKTQPPLQIHQWKGTLIKR